MSAADAVRHTDLLNLIGRDVQLKRVGGLHAAEYAGPCPRCGGTDRFRVWPLRTPPGFWCRACGWKGDAITYLRDVDGLSFPAAVRQLGGRLDSRPWAPRAPAEQSRARGAARPLRPIMQRTEWIVEGYLHGRLDFDNGEKAYYWKHWSAHERRWVKGLAAGVTPADLLYRGELLARTPAGSTVVVCEGEKATDAVRACGYTAVGVVSGAGGTPSERSLQRLTPFDIVLWADADDVGRAHMNRICARLHALGQVQP